MPHANISRHLSPTSLSHCLGQPSHCYVIQRENGEAFFIAGLNISQYKIVSSTILVRKPPLPFCKILPAFRPAKSPFLISQPENYERLFLVEEKVSNHFVLMFQTFVRCLLVSFKKEALLYERGSWFENEAIVIERRHLFFRGHNQDSSEAFYVWLESFPFLKT